MKRIFCSAAFLCAIAVSGSASDHNNLDENLPLRIEDAYPIEYYGREMQGAFLYERTSDGTDFFKIESRLEFGFAPNWQGTIIVPFQYGSAVPDGIGNVAIEALYNFNTEGICLPAFSLSGRADFPTAPDSQGVDTTAKFIFTKSLGRTSFLNQLHVNVEWMHNAGARPNERENRYGVIVGWSVHLGPDTIGIIDYIHEQEKAQGKTSDILEIGVRRQVTPHLVLSAGAGVGLTDESPDFRAVFGIQQNF